MIRLALPILIALGCGGKREQPAAATGASGAASPGGAAPAAAVTGAACPATGLWTECAVFQRLDRAGLAPRRDSSSAAEPPLAIAGTRLRIGNSELEIYIYPDAKARERDEAKLERTKYVDYASPVTMQAQPTLIRSVNLIAILHSRNDHQRERVADALTAGPPQP